MNKHAYLIIAHNNFYVLEKLLKLIDDSRNDIFIHVDKKINKFDFNYFKSIPKYSEINFVERVRVSWGGFSQIKAELNLFKRSSKNKYKYYHLISGVDLPIKSQNYIHDFFDKNSECEFLTYLTDEFTKNQRIYNRINKYYFFQDFKNKNNIVNKLNNGILKLQNTLNVNRYKEKFPIYYGSNWASLTHEAISEILNNEKFIYKNFKYTLCCDEVYKQTILVNNPKFKERLYLKKYNQAHVSYNMRHIDWKRGGPYVFRNTDYDELMNIYSLFARKFDPNIDKEIIDKIYETVSN